MIFGNLQLPPSPPPPPPTIANPFIPRYPDLVGATESFSSKISLIENPHISTKVAVPATSVCTPELHFGADNRLPSPES
jgi:hypothetical protein